MQYTITDLGCGCERAGDVEQVQLRNDPEVPSLSSNDVVLVTGYQAEDIETAGCTETDIIGNALKDHGTVQHELPGAIERNGGKEQVIFSGELPIQLAGER